MKPRFHTQISKLRGYSDIKAFRFDLNENAADINRITKLLKVWTPSEQDEQRRVNESRLDALRFERDMIINTLRALENDKIKHAN